MKVRSWPSGNLPQSDRQPNSFLRTQSYRRPDSFGHSQADKQTQHCERRQYLYTAAGGLALHTPTQALANQRPQLQLCLQLAHMQPSGNRIKMRASNRLASVRSVGSVPPVPSSLAAPILARVRHGSSPTCEGSNAMHRRPSTLLRMHRALSADFSPNRSKRRPSASLPVSLLPLQVPTGISSPLSPGCHKRRRSYKNAPFQGHNIRLQQRGTLQLRGPLGFPGRSDIITVTNICYSNTWLSQ
jgi:hypothetical protein